MTGKEHTRTKNTNTKKNKQTKQKNKKNHHHQKKQTTNQKKNKHNKHTKNLRRAHVAAGRLRQPQIFVGEMRAHAVAAGRMPPVLHVALHELPARATQQLFAREPRRGVHERRRVLQLIAKAEGAARLIITAASPVAAR